MSHLTLLWLEDDLNIGFGRDGSNDLLASGDGSGGPQPQVGYGKSGDGDGCGVNECTYKFAK